MHSKKYPCGESNCSQKSSSSDEDAVNHCNIESEISPNTMDHVSSRCYSFDRNAYILMVTTLQNALFVSLPTLKSFDVRGLLDLKKWRRMRENLCLIEDDNGSPCLSLNNEPSKRIACIEDWQSIVKGAHCIEGLAHHRDLATTLNTLRLTWCVDAQRYGIPMSYIKEFVEFCGCGCQRKTLVDNHYKVDLNNSPMYVIKRTRTNVNVQLEKVGIEHKVRLVMVRSSKKHRASSVMKDYVCHRGGKQKHTGKIR
ncbi:hypothetical protein L7F22_024788 [Adiantum nelumboides]|nr:hypothetical protein [Adiantum nelumboides]